MGRMLPPEGGEVRAGNLDRWGGGIVHKQFATQVHWSWLKCSVVGGALCWLKCFVAGVLPFEWSHAQSDPKICH